MEQNTNDKQFWIDYQLQYNVFQKASLFNIVIKYKIIIYDKLAYCISTLGGKGYIREIIISTDL